MRNTLLSGLSSLLLPLGLYGASATAASSYQRTYLSSSISASSEHLLRTNTALPRDLIDLSGDQLDIQTAHPVRELVIVDGAVAEADKSVLRRALKPGVQLVELDSSAAGLPQLINALDGHKNLAAIHVVSHSEAGVILLGNSRITPEIIQREVHTFAALKGAVREGGDLLFYGCELAANESGEELLDIISNNTGLDVAASNNLTGNAELQGDWELEVTRGNIDSTLAFSENALKDFSGVLFTGTIDFSQIKTSGEYSSDANVNAEAWTSGSQEFSLVIDGLNDATDFYSGGMSVGQAAYTFLTETSVTLRFNGNAPFSPQSLRVANIHQDPHTFSFTSNKGSFDLAFSALSNQTVDLSAWGANVTYITISSPTKVYVNLDNFSVVGVGITVDEDPPVFQNTTPSVGSQTLNGATVSADLNEEGTVYYVVVADGAGAPSAAQVLAGQNSSGAAALASGNFTTTSTTGSEAFSGLSAGTNYDLYVVAQDDEGSPNVQASATLVNFTTQGSDSDATLTAAGGVAEPIGLATTIDSIGESEDVFDFTITDGGTSDGLATSVSQIVVNVSGTSTDAERGKITWRLNGPDASNVTGTYNAGTDTITFSSLSISVADGGNETYTVNAYYNNNTTLIEDRTIILSVDGDTNLTVGGSGTQMASGQSAVTNGSGTTIDVIVSQLVFTTQPAGSVSGAVLTTQPVVRARDAFGNTDVDFAETITLTEASAGTLTNGTQAATAGVATFTNLAYTATADQQAFTLTANDQDGVGSNLPTVDANSVTSDVVATQLVFATQPAPTSVGSGRSTSFTTVPVVSARDANSVVDTGYSTDITLAEVNGAGSATMTGTGDTDGNGATVSITPSSGVSTFTGMQITYTNSGAGSETFNLRASSGGLSTADSSQLTGAPTEPDAPTIGTATAGDTEVSVTFTAPGNNGGEAITTYTATANPGGAIGTCAGPAACTATVTGLTNGTAYTFTVTATNTIGTSVASGASNSATPKGDQTITFPNPGAQNFGTTPTLTAEADSPTGTDNLTVTFSSSTTGVCTITSGGTLTFVTAGSCTIDADQAGDSATNAATTATETFTVNAVVPDAPTIGTATAGDTEATVTFTGPANTGGAAIIASGYTVTASPGGATATGSTSPITVTGLTNGWDYTFTVTATNSAGEGDPSTASNSVTPASPQIITFANPGTRNFGTTPTLTATSDAGGGYPVSFTSSTTGVCTITAGGALTFVTVGSCTINADQAGDSSFLAAPQVSQTFTVAAVAPGAPTAATATAGDTQASIAFTAPVFTGGATITGYTVTSNPGGIIDTGGGSPIILTGLTNGVAYTFTVTATNSAGTGSASAASNSITPAASQTITFIDPGAQNFGTTPTLSATADSGLTPVFTSSTPGVCTITGVGALTFVTAGTCTINADQAGNGSYLPAPQVVHSFPVDAVVPGAPTAATGSAGDTQVSVSFTAPAFIGGAAITGYTVTANPGGAFATGAGSPINVTGLTNGTPYTFTVTATNSAGTGAASTASNSVTPTAPPANAPPIISQGSSTSITMSEDGVPTAFALSLTATDGDGDTLSWSISGAAQQGSASVSGGNVSYTPTANYNGSDSFVVQVSDGDDTDSITVNVTITPMNDAPVISGTPSTSLEQDVAYSFTPVATDVDTADVLTFSIANKPTWASFNTATGALTGTPANADAGISGGIVISVSDGTATTALTAFEIEVIATIDPLQPIVTAPTDLDVNATALFTPVTVRQLLGLSPSATQAEIDQILNGMATDGVSGNSCCTTSLQGLIGTDKLLLPPGRHEATWKATNAVGVSGEAKQVINVRPLVSLSKSQIAVRGSDVTFSVILNGDSPTYPLAVPYVIDASSTATTAEHNLTSGVISFTQKGQLEISIPVSLTEVTGLSDSQLVIALGGGINSGVANTHTIDIRTGNVPPVVSMSISQGGVSTSLVTPGGGPVSVSVTVNDPNKLDTHTFDWSATSGLADTDGNLVDASRTFDPTGLAGSHKVQVTVTDSAGVAVQAQAYFRVVASLPILDTNTDTDLDGVSDELEGAGDTDNNGIPNYLDNMPSPNILPQTGNITNSYLIECDPGVRCGLGLFARGSNSGGVQILNDEIGSLDDLIIDQTFEPVGGIFDFTISDLPTPGQSVRVVIPQQAPIPANAVYRKFQDGAWVSFVSDADNTLHSALGNPGYCPPPGTPDWTSGLTAGHLCVQLTIEDGGPNDDDGLVNSAVVDPGAVSEAKVVVPPVEPPKPPVQVNSKGGGAIPVLWLLLLGGLVILKRGKPARLAAIALATFSINTQAVENTYLRLDVFTVNSSHSEANFTGALSDAGHEFTLNRYDDSRTGFQVAVGYQWSELTYSEVGYLDLGDVEVNLTLAGDTDLDAFASDFADNYPITATGATLVQGLSFKAGSAITLSAEAGAFIWKGEVDLDNAAFALDEDDGVDPLAGVKIDLALGEAFSLGLSGRRIFFGDQDVDLYAVSSTFRF